MATQGEKPGQPGALTKTAPRDAGAAGREPPPDANFIVTKEYRRFTEFADAVRRECYIGLCYGQPGVGKTLSARRYSCWHELGPLLQAARHHFTEGRDRADWHTLLYTPTVSVTPRLVDKELTQLGSPSSALPTRSTRAPVRPCVRPLPAAIRRAAHHRRFRPPAAHRRPDHRLLRDHHRTPPQSLHRGHLQPRRQRMAPAHDRPAASPVRHRPAHLHLPRAHRRRRLLPPPPAPRRPRLTAPPQPRHDAHATRLGGP